MEDRENRTTMLVVVIILLIDILAFCIMNYRDAKYTEEFNVKVNESNAQEFSRVFEVLEENGVYLEGVDTNVDNISRFKIDKEGEKLSIIYKNEKVVSIKLAVSDNYKMLEDSVKKYSRRHVTPIEDCVRALCGIAIPFLILTIIKVKVGDDFSFSPRGDYDDEVGAGGGDGGSGGE